MNIDAFTLYVTSGAVVGISGVTFILNTVLRHNAAYGRLWSVAFVSGILETLSYLAAASEPSAWWASGVGNGAAVGAVGMMWCGCRAYNGRPRPLSWVTIVASLVVTGAFLVEGADGGEWAGALPLFLALAVMTGLAGWESTRKELGGSGHGRVLAIIFWFASFYYLLRAAVYLLAGENSVAFTEYLGTVPTTLISSGLVIVAAICMSVLQPLHGAAPGSSAPTPKGVSGIVSLALFEELVTDWLTRARREREPVVLLEFAIDNIEHITTAFGRSMREATVALVARTACEHLPTATIVAHETDGHFVILTTPPGFGSSSDIAEVLQTALVETPVDPVQGVRATATFGVASTEEFGYEFAELAAAAGGALARAQGMGPGSVVVAPRIEGAEPLDGMDAMSQS
jgi:GGDEF domain-containing protein